MCLKFVSIYFHQSINIGINITVTNKMNKPYIEHFDEILMNDINLEIRKL